MKEKKERAVSEFHEVGFHGDDYLNQVVEFLASGECEVFVETGTNVGSTLYAFAKQYPDILCLSCEPHKASYEAAVDHTKDVENVKIYNMTSQEFMKLLIEEYPDIFAKNALIWCDAHGDGFEWPLRKEVQFFLDKFSNVFLLIGDFKNPYSDKFGYDQYDGQICSMEYIEDIIPNIEYRLYYPGYRSRTSSHHPLRGWGLFVKGPIVKWPEDIKSFLIKEE